ncbi:MAG: hypothetical protein KDA85_22220, partial [Planctomycetaceae bacterium]|nr:hypothetical protein [Planctomycetaceae bacterium]
ETQLTGGRWAGTLSWASVRRLIRSGVCQRPQTERYVQLFAWGASQDDLTSSPDLLSDVWLLFDFDVGVFDKVTMTAKPQHSASTHESWAARILRLVQQGHLKREQLQQVLLASLWKEFRSGSLAGLTKFHDMMRLTTDEMITHQTEYTHHLTNPSGTVVTWATRILKGLADDPRLDKLAVLSELPAVFHHSAAAQPKGGLLLATTLVKADVSCLDAIGDVVAAGLMHSNVDVQEATLKQLTIWQSLLHKLAAVCDRKSKRKTATVSNQQTNDWRRELVDVVMRSSDPVSPLLRESIVDWIVSVKETVGDPISSGSQEDSIPAELADNEQSDFTSRDDLIAEIHDGMALLPDHVRERLPLNDWLTGAAAGRLFDRDPLLHRDQSVGCHCVLPFVEPVERLETVEDVIDGIAAATESVESEMQIEQILEGIQRFGMQRGLEFRQRTAPILRRLNGMDAGFMTESLRSAAMRTPSLTGLISWWLCSGAQMPPSPMMGFGRPDPAGDQLVAGRVSQIRERLLRHDSPVPMLSFPTHNHGWIDPRVFVQRLRETEQQGGEVCRADLT